MRTDALACCQMAAGNQRNTELLLRVGWVAVSRAIGGVRARLDWNADRPLRRLMPDTDDVNFNEEKQATSKRVELLRRQRGGKSIDHASLLYLSQCRI